MAVLPAWSLHGHLCIDPRFRRSMISPLIPSEQPVSLLTAGHGPVHSDHDVAAEHDLGVSRLFVNILRILSNSRATRFVVPMSGQWNKCPFDINHQISIPGPTDDAENTDCSLTAEGPFSKSSGIAAVGPGVSDPLIVSRRSSSDGNVNVLSS
jgi:hypothetical protein